MNWWRMQDAFATHPKITKLTDREFRVWVRILCYCAHQDSPHIDKHAEVKDLTTRILDRFHDGGLLEQNGDGSYAVHDWILYSSAAVGEKVAYYLERNPEATANEIVRALGHRREVVLAEVKRHRPDGSPEPHTNGSLEPVTPVPGNHTRRFPNREKVVPRSEVKEEKENQGLFVARPDGHPDPDEQPPDLTHIRTLIDQSLGAA